VVAGCGSGGAGDAPTTTQADSPTETTQSFESTTTTPTTPEDGEIVVPELLDIWTERGLGTVTLNPTANDGGPHPMMSWEPAPEASSYWLVVHDASGQPYWAWTGSATEVRFGGGDRADLNQTAALHEPMSWSVTAFDADGNVVAFSETASIEP
ncbi:MAG: hypothetical protein DWP92_01220, partial [Armatimonadetes bacterium]